MSLPTELERLKELEVLDLRDNPLPDALLELAEKDTHGALAYIRDQGVEGGDVQALEPAFPVARATSALKQWTDRSLIG